MKKIMTRRSFLVKGSALGVATVLAGKLAPDLLAAQVEEASASGPFDLAVVKGTDPAACVAAAVRRLGGIKRFVGQGARVLINANTATKNRGSNVGPAVLLAVARLCREAGASDICLAKDGPERYWDSMPQTDETKALIDGLRISRRDFAVMPNEKGVALKEVHIDKEVLACDVYINVPLIKNHTGTNFTGVLKNTMGVCPHDPTNRFCHMGSQPKAEGFYEDLEHLGQCIADMNLIRKPDLIVMDCFEFLITNGPFGPGKLGRGDAVVAGTDPVAVDAYATRFLDLKPADVLMIERAKELGLGEMDLGKVRVHEEASG